MHRILASVTTLKQHLIAVASTDGDIYRPWACPYCGVGGLWRHGCYYRKADRAGGDGKSLNPVPVLRYLCPPCERTCSRLPLCMAPRRWFDWAMQQVVLMLLLLGCSVHQCCRSSGRARSTVRRWRDWLQSRSEEFCFYLRSRFPELGRHADRIALWRHVIEGMSLAAAMAWLDRDLVVP
jgi:transposase-like protein